MGGKMPIAPVLIVYNHAFPSIALRGIADAANVAVLECTGDLEDLSCCCTKWSSCIVLIDGHIVNLQGPELISAFIRRAPSAYILAVVKDQSDRMQEDLLLMGCHGFVHNHTEPSVWRKIVRAAGKGELWVSRAILSSAFRAALSRRSARAFSRRELEILRLLAHGFSNQEMAASLYVTQETVRWHLRNVYAKTHMSRRSELVEYAVERFARAAPDAILRQAPTARKLKSGRASAEVLSVAVGRGENLIGRRKTLPGPPENS
jgi:DNA-binding NarL/FixJ family response regulator